MTRTENSVYRINLEYDECRLRPGMVTTLLMAFNGPAPTAHTQTSDQVQNPTLNSGSVHGELWHRNSVPCGEVRRWTPGRRSAAEGFRWVRIGDETVSFGGPLHHRKLGPADLAAYGTISRSRSLRHNLSP